jgi:FkbM family methyltransferase
LLALGATVVAVEPQQELAARLVDLSPSHRLTVVAAALGAREGYGKLLVPAEEHTVASMSTEWVNAVRGTGRFPLEWNRERIVPVRTLDQLIESYGRPVFCKIDVEGYESYVIEGLSQPIRCMSFEFTPEYLEDTVRCLNLLGRLGETRFNYSLGESMRWASKRWISRAELERSLGAIKPPVVFGDIYARFE